MVAWGRVLATTCTNAAAAGIKHERQHKTCTSQSWHMVTLEPGHHTGECVADEDR